MNTDVVSIPALIMLLNTAMTSAGLSAGSPSGVRA